MQTMTPEEWRSFLLDNRHTGKLATVRKDGRPHVVPIWFDLDGEDIVFTTWHTTVKTTNLSLDPRVSICVDDEDPPYAFVQIDGLARFVPGMSELKYWATRIAGRYLGDALAEQYGKRNAVEGELLVRVSPSKVIALKGIAD